ncbi:MAG: SpoIIE family protein phosphatase [Acidobacteriales bacterium]|nr:SpoIIE family protein phosphatase [Terriglobales bacterium]
MNLKARLSQLLRRADWAEKAFAILLILYAFWRPLWPEWSFVIGVPLFLAGAWLMVRLAHYLIKKAIWRLRNRLVVCYILIGVVPLVLVVVLAGLGIWLMAGQVAIYLVTSELNHRIRGMDAPAMGLLALPSQEREGRLRWMAPYIESLFPNVEYYVRGEREFRYPEESSLDAPPEGWGHARGLMLKQGRIYAWTHGHRGNSEVVLAALLNRESLDGLVPSLGEVTLLIPRSLTGTENGARQGGATRRPRADIGDQPQPERLPPPVNRLDIPVSWATDIPIATWDKPGQTVTGMLKVSTRPSAVLRTVLIQKSQLFSGMLPVFIVFAAVAFLIVELIALIIGTSLTRSITGAVHNLYRGTSRVRHGDFAHRIEVRGNDQLAELGRSFNRMTEDLERLLAVAKEKERLQSEIEIAREVQNQLFPKSVPETKHLQITARCSAARMVSGDYYDYQPLTESKIALAFGDVAGKGISAALLMATVQSSFRTQIHACLEAAGPKANENVSTSKLVSHLNQHLHMHSAPEKFSTFFFGVYDDAASTLTYTNAGHLPPILLRGGEATRLEVNGIVVGAFPFAQYSEDRVRLQSGDLLACFTDGVTEPENEYGEMFGEDRLIEVLARNSERETGEVIDAVIHAVHEWTGSPELQDDMTLLLARRV